jgi:hypothetical protein
MRKFYRIWVSSGRHRWHYGTPDSLRLAMWRVGMADITARVTARPAYREMIDTIRWENMR